MGFLPARTISIGCCIAAALSTWAGTPPEVPGATLKKYNPQWNTTSSTRRHYEMQESWFLQDTVLRSGGWDLNLSKMKCYLISGFF